MNRLCKCIDGTIRSFSIISESNKKNIVSIQPEIKVTVIADYSTTLIGTGQKIKTRKNGFKILAQEFNINISNFDIFIEGLYASINEFENVCVHSRINERLNTTYATNESHESIQRGSIFSSLEYVLHFIRNSSKSFLKAAVVITDGVASGFSNSEEMLLNDYLKQISANNLSLTIIQVGCPNGFYPALNFGHVPDSEYLRYIAFASGGKFIYSSDCDYIDQSGTSMQHPNFFHNTLLFKKLVLNKNMSLDITDCVHRSVDTLLVSVSALTTVPENLSNTIQYHTLSDQRFPWTLDSKPPVTKLVLYGLHSYSISPPTLPYILTARFLEGFHLHSVKKIIKLNRLPKVEITFMLPFLYNIMIFYRIRCYHSQLSGITEPGLVKSPQVELFLLSQTNFLRLLLNFKSIQINPLAFSESVKLPIYNSVHKLQRYVSSLYDSDLIFKSFHNKNEELKQLKFDLNGQDEHLLDSILSSMHHMFQNKTISFVEENVFVILRSTTYSRPSGIQQNNINHQLNYDKTRRQISSMYLLEYLSQWSTFNIGKDVFIRYEKCDFEEKLIYVNIIQLNDYAIKLKINFINIPLSSRKAILLILKQEINQIEHKNRGIFINPIIVCKKDIERFVYGPETDHIPHIECFGRSKKFSWFPIEQEFYIDIEMIYNSARQWIIFHRLSEGFTTLFDSPNKIIFYKECRDSESEYDAGESSVCSLLFSLRFDASKLQFETKIWNEPYHVLKDGVKMESATEYSLFSQIYELTLDKIALEIENRDRLVVNQLFTFNYLRHMILKTDKDSFKSYISDNTAKQVTNACSIDLEDLLQSAQFTVFCYKYPSNESTQKFYRLFSDSLSRIFETEILDVDLMRDMTIFLQKLETTPKRDIQYRLFINLLNDETIHILALPVYDATDNEISLISFILPLPTIHSKTILHHSSIAFQKDIPVIESKVINIPIQNKFSRIVLSGTLKYDANNKPYNTNELMNSFDASYTDSLIRSTYNDLSVGLVVNAGYVKLALESCSEVLISMEISDFLRLTPIDSK